MKEEEQAWHRRHAVHIVNELPEDPQDALIVLQFAREFVERFLVSAQASAPVLSLISTASTAARSASRSETVSPLSSPS